MVDPQRLETAWHDARRGSSDGMECLLVLLAPVVLDAARRRLRRIGSPADVVEDLSQEVLYKVSCSVRRCRARTTRQIIAWVHVITQRCALDLLRSPSAPVRFGAVLLDDAPLELAWVASDDAELSTPAIMRLCALAVDAQQVLRPQAAQLLWHRLVEGTSPGDLGRRYGIPEGAIKRRIQRAIASVRRHVCSQVAHLPDAERTELLPWLERWSS